MKKGPAELRKQVGGPRIHRERGKVWGGLLGRPRGPVGYGELKGMIVLRGHKRA